MTEKELPYYLNILVSDPQKHKGTEQLGSSSSSYITYQVSTKTNNPRFHQYFHKSDDGDNDSDQIIVVHRRYSDFFILHQILSNDNPTCIIPPLPDKKFFNYISGDRFSHSFTQKRCHSLQNFLQRISKHYKLSQCRILEIFLANSDWDSYRKNISSSISNLNTNNNTDEVTDAFMNAFKTVHNQSEEFMEIKEKMCKLDHNITKIDKLSHRLVKRQESIVEDYGKLNLNLNELQELVTPRDNDPLVSHGLSHQIQIFSEGISQLSYGLRELNRSLDYEYIVDLKDMEHYIDSMKQLIKLKDQKQIDFEELCDYLTRSINEKNNLISGYGVGSNFLKSKLEEFAGINQEASRREKITKLESKISSLTAEVENAKEVSDAFEKATLMEVEIFERIKTEELKNSLNSLADWHIRFYEKMVSTWSKIEQSL